MSRRDFVWQDAASWCALVMLGLVVIGVAVAFSS